MEEARVIVSAKIHSLFTENNGAKKAKINRYGTDCQQAINKAIPLLIYVTDLLIFSFVIMHR